MKTIPYMGSKRKLLEFLETSINDYYVVNNLAKPDTIFDMFAGSGRVAHHFRHQYRVIGNDKQEYSRVILEAYLQNTRPPEYYKLIIDQLNSLPLSNISKTDGWYTKTYGGPYNNGKSIGLDGKPKPWIDYNAMKIDIVRTAIDKQFPQSCVEKSVLLLSLMLAISKVSNLMGHHVGYFKDWKPGKLNHLHLEMPPIEMWNGSHHEVHCLDMYDAIQQIQAPLVYIDPPYGTNNAKVSKTGGCRYDQFYHLWNTVVVNDRPKVWGKANKPDYTEGVCGDLEYNDKSIVVPSFKRILTGLQTDTICLSYSNKGLLTDVELTDIIEESGFRRDTIHFYTTQHEMNVHSKAGRTEGHCIDRPNQNMPLIEYSIMARR